MRTLTRRVEQQRFEYENTGGDPVGPRPRLTAGVPPLREARSQSFMK